MVSLQEYYECLVCGSYTYNPKYCSMKCMGLGKIGKPLSEEHKQNVSRGRKGVTPIFTNPEERRQNLSKALKGNPKLIVALKGKKKSPEHIANVAEANRGKKRTLEQKENISNGHLNSDYVVSDETREKLSKISNERWKNLEYIEKVSEGMKAVWSDPEYKNRVVQAIMMGNEIRPTKPETALNSILQKSFPSMWMYTGDGSKIIGGKNPDFVSDRYNLIIEMYGEYWHRGQDPQERIDHFKEYGYDCLVIWENELRNEKNILQRLDQFCDLKGR